MKHIDVLDTTLRDGSYAIDFEFTSDHTRYLASRLQEAGVKYIEIGHGFGLNASNKGLGKAVESDLAYLKAAGEVIDKSLFGMFYLPGIADLKHINMAANEGMGFIRIGTNAGEIYKAEAPIKYAKDLGLEVSSNILKSYVATPGQLLKDALLAESYGADNIVVVDSAGGMLPDQVTKYVCALKDGLNVKIGFHGHNNLSLAMANSVIAVQNGAEIIDGSLRGLGRSAGNTEIEILLLVLKKMGYHTGIDINKMLDLGDDFVAPLLEKYKRPNTPDAVIGFSEFHSSYLPILESASKKYGIDLRRLIVEVSKVDRVYVSPELVSDVCKRLIRDEG